MKINKNLLIHTEISSWNEEWKISANLKKEGYYTPSLFCLNPLTNFKADNPTWIVEELLKNLKILLEYKTATNLSSEEILKAVKFEIEELEEIPREDYQTIIDLIEQAIELGFFREHYDKSK